MALIQFTFRELNSSVQEGDLVYFLNPTTNSGFQEANINNIQQIGRVGIIRRGVDVMGLENGQVNEDGVVASPPYSFVNIIVDTLDQFVLQGVEAAGITPDNSFIFFSKNNTVNAGSLKGYYASIEFRNNSTTEAEMFSASCDVTESSK
tara:strand:- start:184 stop:630 length:447 start_codon:yes stop_codon:yes gene_type:complete